MAMKTPQELFLHELGDMFDAEQKIVKMLPLLANESDNPEVKAAFEQHEQETMHQIGNLERCFAALSSNPEKVACEAIAGLKKEHDAFRKEGPSKEILTMFNLGGASKMEYYEIASYKGLIEKATLMSQTECVHLLQENRQQEEAMAKKVEQMSRQLGMQMSKK